MTKLKRSELPWWGDKFNRFFIWGHQQLLLSQLPASFFTSYMIHDFFHIYHHKQNICILCSNSTSTFRELMIISLHFPRTELSVTLGGGNVTTLFSWGVEGADNEDFVLGDGELLRLDLSLFGVFLSPFSSGFPPDFSLSWKVKKKGHILKKFKAVITNDFDYKSYETASLQISSSQWTFACLSDLTCWLALLPWCKI